jgi:acyl-CoA synthetase (NDP forming)
LTASTSSAAGARNDDRLARLFEPDSIAIVGATETPGLTRDLLQTLPGRGFEGLIYPVNPRYTTIAGLPCYADVRDLPSTPDLAVILLAPERVPTALVACADRGIRNVVVCSSGFAETGEAGASLQRQVASIAETFGMTLLGPNSIGFINVARSVAAIAIPPASVPERLRPGGAALIAQSAGIMISAMEYGSQVGLGFSYLVSTGNEADVEALECLEHVLGDPSTTAVGLVLESVRDGRRLVAAVRRAHHLGKRVVVLKLGRSKAGAEAVLTHTAGLAGTAEVFDAVCREIGLTQVETIAELVDTLVLFEKWRSRKLGGLAVVTISGGTKVLVADLAERYGAPLAELAPATTNRLTAVIPAIGVAGNPLDVTAASIEDAGVFEAAVQALTADPGVAAIALVMHLKKHGGSPAHQRLVRRFVAAQATADAQLMAISTIPEGVSGFWFEEAALGPVPFLNGLGSLRAVGAYLAAPRPKPETPGDAASAATAPPAIVQRALDSGAETLTEAETYELLAGAGIRAAPFRVVDSVPEALEAAREIGYPVALKIVDPTVAHRMRVGGVVLALSDPDELAAAGARLRSQWPAPAARLLVQQMVAGGIELLVGAHVDPQFGPIVTLGFGGTRVEISRDVAHRLAPIERAAAADALGGLSGWRALARDIDPIVAAPAVAALSQLAVELAPWISSIEINPLVVSTDGCVAVDALAELVNPTG